MSRKQSLFKKIGEDFLLLVKLNLIFIIASVPVVTIPAAATAMMKICTERVREREVDLIPDFILYFRVAFFTSLRTGFFLAASALLFGYVLWFYQSAVSGAHLFLSVLRGGAAVQFLIVCLTACYMLVTDAVADLPFLALLKVSFQLMIVYIRQTLLCLLASVVLLIGSILAFPWSAPFLFAAAFSLWSYICAYYLFPVVEKHVELN